MYIVDHGGYGIVGRRSWLDASIPINIALTQREFHYIYRARGVKKINLRYHVPKHFTQKSSAKCQGSCPSTIRSKIGREDSGGYVTMTQTSVPACRHDRPWSIMTTWMLLCWFSPILLKVLPWASICFAITEIREPDRAVNPKIWQTVDELFLWTYSCFKK